MKIIALATCFNRKDMTLRALDSLQKQLLPTGYSLDFCIVDDGSTDGTSDAMRSSFPNVTILNGSGNLYWAGGMRFGWDKYVKQQDMDYLLVFNDDINLYQNALKKLLSAADEAKESNDVPYVVTGAFIEPNTKETAYSGLKRSSRWHPLRFKKINPKNVIQDCDTLNMNLTLISRKALNQIGFLSQNFIHSGADYDYGLRLRAKGGRVILASNYIGECSLNSIKGTSSEPGISFRERWHRLTSIKEQPPRQRALYFMRHAGWMWPLFWLLPYVWITVTSIFTNTLRDKNHEG